MEFALAIGIFILGGAAGALIAHALTADRYPMNIHSARDDLEARVRRVQ